MLRIALLRFASSNPFARSLRSLGVLVPPLWPQKKTAKCGLLFWCPGGDSNPPWRFIYLHLVAFNVFYQRLAANWIFDKMQIDALRCRESSK
jgi:hypothetical protein